MKKFKDYFILLAVFSVFWLVYGFSTGSMIIDFSRESYIPYKMLSGGKLFKDIFVIYGIFGYIVNAFLYKIYLNLNSILFLSTIISIIITYLFYRICNLFTKNKNYSLLLTIGFISLSIFSNSTFSFILPYSYSTLWAVLGSYSLLFFLLKNNQSMIFLSLGLIFANRIEFFIPLFLITIFYLFKKKIKIGFNFLFIFLAPAINLFYIFLNNISFSSISKNLFYIQKMLQTHSLNYFYKSMGVYYEPVNFIRNLIIISFIGLIIYLIYKFQKFRPFGLFIFSIFIIIQNPNECLNLIIVPLLLYVVFNFKKLDNNLIILFLFGTVLCLKSIFKTGTISYSNFGFFLIVLFAFVFLEELFKNSNKKIAFTIFTIYIAICNIYNFIYFFFNPKFPIETEIGKIYLSDYEADLYTQISIFLRNNLKKDDTFSILPEGEIFNLIFKKPHNFYNSTFTPLDIETFGENKITSDIKKNFPKYLIFFPRNTSDYGKPTICKDYGIDLCSFIEDNYAIKKAYRSRFIALIYERKTK